MRPPLLTVAAVVLVAATTALVLATGAVARPAGVGAAPTAQYLLEPLPPDQLPGPSGEPATDEALARCATAVVRTGHAAEYPPTAGWRSTLHMGTGAVRSELTIDGSFGCLVGPGSVAVSGTSGTEVGGIQLVRMAPDELLVLNPDHRRFTIGPGDKRLVDDTRVLFVALYGAPIGDVRLTVGRFDGPVPDPQPALTVLDRALPDRNYSPDGVQLAQCLERLPSDTFGDPALWVPVGRHEGGDAGPGALVARIGDASAGFCVFDPGDGPTFTAAPLGPPGDRPRAVDFYRGATTALLLTAPPGVTRVQIAAQATPDDRHDCTLLDGLAMCTLNATGSPADPRGHEIVVTAATAADPRGSEVYRN